MKHIILTSILLLFGFSSINGQETAALQFQKNNRSLSFVPQGGQIAGNYGGGLSIRGGYFFADKWDAGLLTGFAYYNNYLSIFSLTPSVKYYPTQWQLSPVFIAEFPMRVSYHEEEANITILSRIAAGAILLNKKRSFGFELNGGYALMKERSYFSVDWAFSFFF